ncbi:MAG: Hpt domain-containing protein [Verrucomicrobiota bacterium]|nr:Hpt domain-containing protein [Verrucomicrobiota bacterium]
MNTYGDIPLLDQEQIDMLIDAGGDSARELFNDLERLFVEETGPRLLVIEDALKTGQLIPIAKQVHAIAGASANLGGMRLSAACKAIERKILDEPTVSVGIIAAMTEDLKALFETTIRALHEKILKM